MFALSKIVGSLLDPANLILVILVVAVLLLRMRSARWVRRGRRLILALTTALILICVLPWEQWVISPLEDRFPPPLPAPAQVDGIVVLGGAVEPLLSSARHQVSLNPAAERMVALVELGRRYPNAKLVFTGGSGSVLQPEPREAQFVRVLLDDLGFDSHRVIFEAESRNTVENAIFSRQLAAPQPEQTWLLVTSAIHMPRAMGTFAAAGWRIQAYPVDYLTPSQTNPLAVDLSSRLSHLSTLFHEWLGLIYYRVRGWTKQLVPAPDAL